MKQLTFSSITPFTSSGNMNTIASVTAQFTQLPEVVPMAGVVVDIAMKSYTLISRFGDSVCLQVENIGLCALHAVVIQGIVIMDDIFISEPNQQTQISSMTDLLKQCSYIDLQAIKRRTDNTWLTCFQ